MNEQIITALYTTAVQVRYYTGMVDYLQAQLLVCGLLFGLFGAMIIATGQWRVPRWLYALLVGVLFSLLVLLPNRVQRLGEHTAAARRWQGLHAEAQQLAAQQLPTAELELRLRRLADEEYALQHEEPLVYDKAFFEACEEEVTSSFALPRAENAKPVGG